MAFLGAGFALNSLLERSVHSRTLAAVCLLLFTGSFASSTAGGRWYFPFLNIVGQRVLPDPSAKRWFIRHGMPASSALDRRAGSWASDDDGVFYRDPGLTEFRAWARDNGRRVYLRYLEKHPGRAFLDPLENWQDVLLAEPWGFYLPRQLSTSLTDMAEAVVYPREPIGLFAWALVAVAAALIACYRRSVDSRHLVPVVLLMLVYPALCLVWHGDAMEVNRHGLQVGVQLRLALAFISFLPRRSTD